MSSQDVSIISSGGLSRRNIVSDRNVDHRSVDCGLDSRFLGTWIPGGFHRVPSGLALGSAPRRAPRVELLIVQIRWKH